MSPGAARPGLSGVVPSNQGAVDGRRLSSVRYDTSTPTTRSMLASLRSARISLPCSTSEIEHPARSGTDDDVCHGGQALFVEADRPFDGFLLCVMSRRSLVRVNRIVFQQTAHHLSREMAVVAEIAIGDQLTFRMVCEPRGRPCEAASRPRPVQPSSACRRRARGGGRRGVPEGPLASSWHLGGQRSNGCLPSQEKPRPAGSPDASTVYPSGSKMRLRTVSPPRQGTTGSRYLEWDLELRKLGALFAPSAHGRREDLGERHGHERRRTRMVGRSRTGTARSHSRQGLGDSARGRPDRRRPSAAIEQRLL